MSSSDFRQIASGAESGRADRLFRAAVSAFCALTRPSRREIAQLEDLTLPLFDAASPEGRRYVAAILSEIDNAPPELVRRLSDEPVGTAAPLLIRSKALTDVDLIRLISRHGVPHARAIARRPGLNPTIADLIRALDRPAVVPAGQDEGSTKENLESVRQRLRGMMLSPQQKASQGRPLDRNAIFEKLRSTALAGRLAFFQTALGDALGVGFRRAASITDAAAPDELLTALRALDLAVEQAFLLATIIRPGRFSTLEDIRQFVSTYERRSAEEARNEVKGWRGTVAPKPRENEPARPSGGVLKAS